MSIIIDGTNGVSDVDGSASTPAIRGSDTNTGMFFPAADTIAFAEGGVEVVRIDSSGNMGIRTSSPSAPVTVGRVDSSNEGGQIDLCRASDNTSVWAVDVFGNTSTPTLRFVDNVAAVTRASIDGSGNFAFNSGYGSAATAYGCRAWVNFDGTTNVGGFCTIRASGNVSSVADNGTGNYTVNFTTAMPDANYITVGAGNNRMVASSSQTTSASTLNVRDGSGALSDVGQVNVAIFR